jgi:hypothetical protein
MTRRADLVEDIVTGVIRRTGRRPTRLQALRVTLAWCHGYLDAWLDKHRHKLSLQYWLGRWAGSRWGG